MSPRGRFVTLEGGEGVGKSTQAALLADHLRGRGDAVVLTREPGGTPGAETIRTLLMTGDAERWSASAEALLFAAARADHVERVIGSALARGDWVVCDRFVDSTRAYQGGAGGIADADVLALHRIGSGGLLPDLTLLLTLPIDQAMARARHRDGNIDDRFADRGDAYHRDLQATFERMARAEPRRFRQIDAAGAVAEVAGRIRAAVAELG